MRDPCGVRRRLDNGLCPAPDGCPDGHSHPDADADANPDTNSDSDARPGYDGLYEHLRCIASGIDDAGGHCVPS